MTSTTATGRGGVRTSPRPGAPRITSRLREAAVGYGFLAPNLILMAVFLFWPILWAIGLSFQETKGFGDPEWVGLDNYAKLVGDPVFWQSLWNTVVLTVFTVPIDMIGGLGLAVLLNSVLPGRGVFRTIIVLPMVISGVASGMIAVIIFYQSTGIINKTLLALGLPAVEWQSGSIPAMLSVIIASIWLRIGFNMIIYLAGLQGISPELYEAARIDGASRWQQFRSITVPLVGPSTFFLLIMNVIASFQAFDLIFVMTGGGPGYSTSVLGTYAYRNGFQIREQGYGAAIGVVLLVITLAFTYIQWRTSRTRDLVE
ncbi:carbohydrate ABC transporter permease [Salinibacterium soli]|uniref:Sugar ABC transporter permease n=1 Tax=Antiquaquibacter soli TaxID=3064523 RepID=A0ABT9BQW4_9MICO|nr:sugar ABC transporter permease [Protaetiibacter sp. WY-16]MDO7883029.1 sugar ABC transporter permease [Protaetiibacter sp. WY-16]